MTRPLSGIYKITNLKTGKIYVGQSKNIFYRRKQHFTALRNGTHENQEMQKDWNKDNHGFRWDILEYCGLNELNEREKYWIDKLNTLFPNGYNQGWVPYKRKNATSRRVKGYRRSR